MHALDRILPTPRLLEIDVADVAAPPARVWSLIRHGDLGRTPLIRALFQTRELPALVKGERPSAPILRIDELQSTPERPGFQILADDAPREIVVGAIGKVWHLDIPFAHVDGADAFAAFDAPDWVKVAWALRVEPSGDRASRIVFELHVDATDDEAWTKFRRYFAIIGPASHFIRRTLLSTLVRELGSPDADEESRALPGDELLPDAVAQVTHGITIDASPDAIWPWLVQMGCGRAGYYSHDLLDNRGTRSAREIHPELQHIQVGDVLPATPESKDGFEVLRLDAPRALVLGGLFDPAEEAQRPFASPRPDQFWHVTWSFVLEPLAEGRTRLHVRARAAFSSEERLHAAWIRPVHSFMQTAQLRHLAARVTGELPQDDLRDVLEGLGGAARILFAWLTPFLRRSRSHWGVDEATAERVYPGDALVPAPRWSWTHGIEIDAPASEVWSWIAQIGADRGGFYSYQWLENLAGCHLRNAETIHPEWEVREGDALSLSPSAPPLRVIAVDRGRSFVAFGAPDEAARAAGRPWAAASWAFCVEPLGEARSRLVSRYRAACSDDLAMRLSMGPTILEPVGFAMDRRMLLGVKRRAETSRNVRNASAVP